MLHIFYKQLISGDVTESCLWLSISFLGQFLIWKKSSNPSDKKKN